jgi:hypothetical protein
MIAEGCYKPIVSSQAHRSLYLTTTPLFYTFSYKIEQLVVLFFADGQAPTDNQNTVHVGRYISKIIILVLYIWQNETSRFLHNPEFCFIPDAIPGVTSF